MSRIRSERRILNGERRLVDRADRRDLSIFRIGEAKRFYIFCGGPWLVVRSLLSGACFPRVAVLPQDLRYGSDPGISWNKNILPFVNDPIYLL